MDWRRIIKAVSVALFFIGFTIVVGAVGTDDYCIEVGVYRAVGETVKPCLIGLAMMVPAAIVLQEEDED